MQVRLDEIIAAGEAYDMPFDLQAMTYEELVGLANECRKRWEPGFRAGQAIAGIEEVMNATSAELPHRRIAIEQETKHAH